MPEEKTENCRVCGNPVTMIVQRGSGYCCARCAESAQDDGDDGGDCGR